MCQDLNNEAVARLILMCTQQKAVSVRLIRGDVSCRSNTLSLGAIRDLRLGSLDGSAQSIPEKESSRFHSTLQMEHFPQLARL